MLIEGKLEKSGSWWAASVPAIGVFTQGKTKSEAYEMVKDAIESLDDEGRVRVKVKGDGDSFYVSNGNASYGTWLAFVLRRIREESGKSLEDIRAATHATSRNAYARYESGDTIPSVQKFAEILSVLSPNVTIVIR